MNTTYNPLSTSTVSVFRPLTIDPHGAWPGVPPKPLQKQQLPQRWDQGLEPAQGPMAVSVNPRWYYRWLRHVMPDAYARVFYMPAGSTTAITAERSQLTGGIVAQWAMAIAGPESSGLEIVTHRALDRRNIQPEQGEVLRYQNELTVGVCRTAVWPTISPDYAEPIETHSMDNGSVVFDPGNQFWQVRNTAQEDRSMVVIYSIHTAELDGLVTSPTSRVRFSQ